MTLSLHNTMSRKVEPFQPLVPGRVTFYACGPTVYNFAHIGNFRTFLFEDLLHRWLTASGLEVFYVMNLTDVDDKTIKGANEAGKPLREHVEQYIEAFHADRGYLRIRDASVYPRATEFIEPMIELVSSLIEKGVAYRSDDGSVYFAIGKFPAYGRLSRLDTRQLLAGASERVSTDEYAKDDARDFVLWKAARPEDEAVGAAWDAPFGRGRPGWHLECSAMALALIGEKFGIDVLDIHAGGVDLIFPHHEDEIAQSCAYTGQQDFARFWLHGEFMTLGGTKMSKRYGNFLTARDLAENDVDAGTVRLLVYNTHYRQPLDWSDEALGHAREGSRRLGEFRDRARASKQGAESAALVEATEAFRRDFTQALNDDLNSPRALAALFGLARDANRELDAGSAVGDNLLSCITLAEQVLDVFPTGSTRLTGQSSGDAELAEVAPAGRGARAAWAVGWAGRRFQARLARDYAEADRIRAMLEAEGFEVRDTRDGVEVVAR